MTSWECDRIGELHTTRNQILIPLHANHSRADSTPLCIKRRVNDESLRVTHLIYTNEWRCAQRPLYGIDLRQCVSLSKPFILRPSDSLDEQGDNSEYAGSGTRRPLILSNEQRARGMEDILTRYTCVIHPARASPPILHCSHPSPSDVESMARETYLLTQVSCALWCTLE